MAVGPSSYAFTEHGVAMLSRVLNSPRAIAVNTPWAGRPCYGRLSPVLAKSHSFGLVGIDAIACEVEADVSQRGLGKVKLVGLPQAAVKESAERVRRAIINSGYSFPSMRCW